MSVLRCRQFNTCFLIDIAKCWDLGHALSAIVKIISTFRQFLRNLPLKLLMLPFTTGRPGPTKFRCAPLAVLKPTSRIFAHAIRLEAEQTPGES